MGKESLTLCGADGSSSSFSNFFYNRETVHREYGYIERPAFREHRVKNVKEFDPPWDEFKSVFSPFLEINTHDGSEIIFTDKDVSWNVRDVNIWIGNRKKRIDEIDDLTDQEGSTLFDIGVDLCGELNNSTGLNHSLTIATNPLDIGMPGNQSVRKLHIHLRSFDDPADLRRIQKKSWKEMLWFDKLAFIEPFTSLYFDFAKNYLSTRDGLFKSEDVSMLEGIVRFSTDPDKKHIFFPDLKDLYSEMKQEYSLVEAIFTDRKVDPVTDRYLPLPPNIRRENLFN
jgi:hypothetical protein